MVDLVQQYRQDLEAQLRQGLTPYEAQIMAEEVEQHLRQRIAASIELGASPETAQLEAIAAMGPTSQLATEFGRQIKEPKYLSPLHGNVAVFLSFCIPILFSAPYTRNIFFNIATVVAWFLIPALCRKWPVWGILAGVAALEAYIVIALGNSSPNDIVGIAIIIGLTYATFSAAVGVRWMTKRIRTRRERRRLS